MSPTHQDLSNDTTFSQIKSRVPLSNKISDYNKNCRMQNVTKLSVSEANANEAKIWSNLMQEEIFFRRNGMKILMWKDAKKLKNIFGKRMQMSCFTVIFYGSTEFILHNSCR